MPVGQVLAAGVDTQFDHPRKIDGAECGDVGDAELVPGYVGSVSEPAIKLD
jgi:hypothetical protein